MITDEVGDVSTNLFLLDDLKMLSEIDSSQFGFLKLNNPENVKKKALVLKAVKCLERFLVKNFRNKENDPSAPNIYKNQIENLSEQLSSIRTDDAPRERDDNSSLDIFIPNKKERPPKLLSKEELHVRTFRKLGHYHLLLQEFDKALSAYQVYMHLNEDHWKVVYVLYGSSG
ncbi:uncharacterized protein NPIL_408011 [Nephila pilipes]|uniref:Uncharacterized protein n=1 Tax=Nephila pilipes TaxID=299642 RepID=A0A8X6PH43_NEPPI|nr:uncharacterized protein NPIL_408011 [Nephila pilipes]